MNVEVEVWIWIMLLFFCYSNDRAACSCAFASITHFLCCDAVASAHGSLESNFAIRDSISTRHTTNSLRIQPKITRRLFFCIPTSYCRHRRAFNSVCKKRKAQKKCHDGNKMLCCAIADVKC